MNNAKEQISSRTLMFSIACFIQSSTILISFVSSTAKQDTWFVVITGFITVLPVIWVYIELSKRFPGKSLIEINDIVFGNILGKVFSSLYIFFFFSLTFLNSSLMGDFVVGSLLPEMPKLAIIMVFIIVCAYAVRKGIETITRCSALFFLVTIGVLLANSILSIGNMKFSNFQPSFTLPLIKYIQATQTEAFLPFSEIMAFFMLFPSLKDPKKIAKPLLGGLLIGAFLMFLVVSREIAVLGPVISYVSNPAYAVIRLISIANILTRMEMLYATILLMLQFFKICILFYATVKGLEQIFCLKSYKLLVPIIGVLSAYAAATVFDSSMQSAFWGTNVAAVYSTFFGFVLPFITLMVVLIKGIKKKA